MLQICRHRLAHILEYVQRLRVRAGAADQRGERRDGIHTYIFYYGWAGLRKWAGYEKRHVLDLSLSLSLTHRPSVISSSSSTV